VLALNFADDSFKKDRNLVLEAVKENGRVLEYVDASLKRDKEIVLAAVSQFAGAILVADDSFRGDRDVMRAALRQNGRFLRFADDSLKGDREIALFALKHSWRAFDYVAPSLLKDEDFLFNAACSSINVMSFIKNDGATWRRVLKKYDNFGELKIPKDSIKTFAAFKSYMEKRYDIKFLGRFSSIENFIEVAGMRDPSSSVRDARPLAIFISPTSDWNHSLEQYPTIDRLIELGYRVSYYEAENEMEAEQFLSDATGGGGDKASLIILAGHGGIKTLALGSADLGMNGEMENEEDYIDTGDFSDKSPNLDLAKYISRDGDLLLYSCWNGWGEEKNPDNLANTIARSLPGGVTIYSSSAPMAIKSIGLDDDGELKISLSRNSLYTLKGLSSP